ncbi:MFS transporter [Cupriavidus sp. WKF15]|uniref:MFS transporter n=1 Tax=Cupriavidus sp. WKF15 TaxID=3032282 RepID=UPI0023E0D839|nr:MFS transporter [Cupriavidus sp. WKF15]WER50332.1 MFS transporter [Cupriavidus sp. WKF15]
MIPTNQHRRAAVEDALYRKVSLRVIPFLFVAYVVSFIDRINIGFAQLQMKGDLGFSDAVYGLGAGIFFIGYFLFEVPSNLLLHRIGARRTFVRIMACWGLVSAGMAFVVEPWQLYGMRFLLGLFEAGFFPGIVLYLTYWFPSSRRAAATSWMFVGIAVAGVVGGIVSGAIIDQTNGLHGLRGWQWMFILEGLPAVVLGIVAYWMIDDGPRTAVWLTPQERHTLLARLSEEKSQNTNGAAKSLRDVLRDARVYLLAAVYFSLVCGTMAISFWLPAVIKGAGAKTIFEVGYLSAIPYGVGTLGILLISRHSDAKQERRWHYLACTVGGGIALFVLAFWTHSLPAALALLAIAVTFSFSALPVFWTIPQRYLSGVGAAGGIAVISSLGQLGSFFSPTMIGWIKATTGSLNNGLIVLGALMILGGIGLFLALGNLETTGAKSPDLTAAAET